jgi:hypothetical protein
MSIYQVDAGFFPTPIEICFSSKEFFKVLKRYGVPEYLYPELMPLDKGIAETYAFSNRGAAQFVLAVFNVEAIANDSAGMVGVVAHESVHIAERVFEHVGEEDDAGEETRAYLLQYLVEQIYMACVSEIDKYAKRKSNRKTSSQLSKAKEGSVSEVGEPQYDGGTGQDSPVQRTDSSSGTKGPTGEAISTTDVLSWTIEGNRDRRPRIGKRGRS